MTLEQLCWARCAIEKIPMVDRGVRDHSQACFTEPFPKYNVLGHSMGLQLGFVLQIEQLYGSTLSLERDDLFARMHDGAIGVNGTFGDHAAIVLEV